MDLTAAPDAAGQASGEATTDSSVPFGGGPACRDESVAVQGPTPAADAPPVPRPEDPAHDTLRDDTDDAPVADGSVPQRPAARGEQPDPADAMAAATPLRRSPGSMHAAVLDICRAHPDRQFKVGELCRLIDAANAGTGARKASQGAVYNAATKLAAAGTLIQTADRPATFQLTGATN